MNRQNIQYMIGIMESAKNLHMPMWQVRPGDTVARSSSKSIEDLHACGNTACFAGYMAISEKFQADGGGVEWIADIWSSLWGWGSGEMVGYSRISS